MYGAPRDPEIRLIRLHGMAGRHRCRPAFTRFATLTRTSSAPAPMWLPIGVGMVNVAPTALRTGRSIKISQLVPPLGGGFGRLAFRALPTRRSAPAGTLTAAPRRRAARSSRRRPGRVSP